MVARLNDVCYNSIVQREKVFSAAKFFLVSLVLRLQRDVSGIGYDPLRFLQSIT